MKQVILITFCLCFSTVIYWQGPVTGVVIDSGSNKPIESAHVAIEHSNKTLGTTTDQKG